MIKYSVIESQRKVIAKIENCENDAYNVLNKACKGYMNFDACEVKMPNKFKAVAKCHPNDTFDVEEGKRIARERVIEKYNKTMANILVGVFNVFQICKDNVAECTNRYLDTE